jgi:Uma2 family endonuclease
MAIPAAHFGPWTEQDLLAMPDDGQRYELVEGSLVVSPAPASLHQYAADQLVQLLKGAAPPHLVAVGAAGVRIPGNNFLVPDVLVANKAAVLANNTALEADLVQLVVEIVSPGSIFKDTTTKPLIYAGGGIPNFWRVELNGPSIIAFHLENGFYKEVASAQAGELLMATEPFAVNINPATLVS